jgi:ankyrin repeat protein
MLVGKASALALFMTVVAAAGSGDPPLVEAARKQDQRAIRAFLNEKIDVNARSSDGSTALLWLSHGNDVDSSDLLLRAGADPNLANDFRMTPLSEACTKRRSICLTTGPTPISPRQA